jgi:hypothetical protein
MPIPIGTAEVIKPNSTTEAVLSGLAAIIDPEINHHSRLTESVAIPNPSPDVPFSAAYRLLHLSLLGELADIDLTQNDVSILDFT